MSHLGVVCNISAWNYPYLVGVNVFVPALLAGNAVMYKPSEYATLTGLEIEKLLKQAGIPANIFHVAIGAGNTVSYYWSFLLMVIFLPALIKQGNTFMKNGAENGSRQCEMGGKDPLYVAGDIKT